MLLHSFIYVLGLLAIESKSFTWMQKFTKQAGKIKVTETNKNKL